MRAGVLSALLLAAAALTANETATDPDPDSAADDVVELERLSVTGTRIKRTEADGVLPVTVIERETIDLSGESSLADFVRSLSFNTHGSYRSQMFTGGMGTAQVSLRGLGAQRSLVLVDGRRLTKSPMNTDIQDLNTIPMGSVERIEVLSDGASAVYGSDAIAGVVNVITRDDYDGWELMYGRAEPHSGGGRTFGSIMYGHGGEDWKLVATFSFNDRDISLNRDFAWTVPALDPYANNFSIVDADSGFDYQNFTAIADGCSGSDALSLVPFPFSLNGLACVYDVNREAADETSVGTRGVLLKFDYDFSLNWTGWLNASSSVTEASGLWAPIDSWFNYPYSAPLPPDSPNNPTNPASDLYDPAFGPNSPVNYWHRFTALGNVQEDVETTLEDLQLGMTTQIGRTELDFGLRFSRSESQDLTRNAVRPLEAHELVADGAYDLQNPWDNPEDVLAAIRHDELLWWDFDQDEVFATASWDGLNIGDRPLEWVLGGEFRTESWRRDSEDQWFGPPDSSDRDVLALYFESLLPLTPDAELSLAGRYDDYSDWGNNFSPKLSLRWRIFDQLVLRGSWGEGFKAPEASIPWDDRSEWSDWTQNDPQSCEALGQPAGCWIPFLHIDRVSPELGPEQSEQYSFGVIWEPGSVFTLVLDYYNITVEDEISYVWSDLLLILERERLPIPPGLGVERDPSTGQLLSITTGLGNRGLVETSGIDLTLNFAIGIGPGRWNSHLLGSYIIEDVYNGFDTVGLAGAPRYRATLSNRYDIRDLTLAWNIHYISSQDGEIPDWSYGYVPRWLAQDMQVAWDAPWKGTLAIGAQNLFNKQPALDVGYTGGNRYNTMLYDAFGRILYARYTQTF